MTKTDIVKMLLDDLYLLICGCFDYSRERSLALTKLEECKLWLERANMK